MVNSTGSIGSGIELQCVLKSEREKIDRRKKSEKIKYAELKGKRMQ